MYFADSCLLDKNSINYIVGRLQVCNDDVLDPPNHLRAAMFVIDRCAVQLLKAGLTPEAELPRASYILDISDLPLDSQCTHSGTGFGNNIKVSKARRSEATSLGGKSAYSISSRRRRPTKRTAQGSRGSTTGAAPLRRTPG